MKLKFLKICCLILFAFHGAYAQNHISFYKLWGLYTYNGRYNDLLYLVEPQLRLVNRPGVYEQFLLNGGLGFWANHRIQLWAGQTIVNNLTSNNIAEDIRGNVSGEYRLWQQINYVNNDTILGKILFRNRLEERHPEILSSWSVRFRDRLYWSIPIAKNQSLFISDELFINLKRPFWISTQTFDQNRLFLGILQTLSPSLNFTISYLNQYINTRIPEVNHGIVINLIYTVPNFFS
jgi:hypothetical protein